MKKSLVLIAMAGVALASCVNNEVVDVPQNEQEKVRIAFDKPIYTNVDSRVNHTGVVGENEKREAAPYPETEDLHLFARYHSGNFNGWTNSNNSTPEFGDDDISFVEIVDSWAPTYEKNGKTHYYYWEPGKKLSYAAYSPANLNEVNATDGTTLTLPDGDKPSISYGEYTGTDVGKMGLTITNFKTPIDSKYHYDLLFSQLHINSTSTDMDHNPNFYSGLPIQFQHALSRIAFSIHSKMEEHTAYLKSIKLKNVKLGPATFKENLEIPASNPGESTSWSSSWSYNRIGAQKNVTPSWTFDANPIVLDGSEQKPAFVAYQAKPDTPGAPFFYEPKHLRDQIGDGDTYFELFLIPQEIGEAAIEVTYNIDGASQDIVNTYSLSGRYKETETAANAISRWDVGTKYVYRLVLDDQAVNDEKILFSPRVDGWTEIAGLVIYLGKESIPGVNVQP